MDSEKERCHKCSDFEEKVVNLRTPNGNLIKSTAYECVECTTVFVPQEKAEKIQSEDKSVMQENKEYSPHNMVPVDLRKTDCLKDSSSTDDIENVGNNGEDPLIGTLTNDTLEPLFQNHDVSDDNNAESNTDDATSHSIESPDAKTEVSSNVFSCKKCSNTVMFASLSTMFQHYRDMHNMECTPDDLIAYNCYVCNTQYGSQKELDEHLLTKCNSIATYNCKHCEKKFDSHKLLDSHMIECEEKNDQSYDSLAQYECTLCLVTFHQHQDLVEHHRNKHMGEKVYKCDYCPASFSWPENLERHMKIHEESSSKPEETRILCKVCSNPCHSVFSLASHMSLSHPDHPFTQDGTWGVKSSEEVRRSKRRRNTCAPSSQPIKLVNAVDEDLSEFVAELANSSAKKRNIDCETDPSKAGIENSADSSEPFDLKELGNEASDVVIIEEDDIGVQKLVNAVAAQSDPHSLYCSACDKTYQDSTTDKISMNLHCSRCGWTFKKHYQLEAHIEHLHPPDILQSICRVCHMRLKNNTAMDRHYTQEHADSKVFHCYQCDSQFNTKSCLRGHLLRHRSSKDGKGSGEHICPHCSMRYAHAHQLLTHITKSHQAFVPKPGIIGDLNTMFVCGFCSKRFTYEGSLKIHLKQHEEKIKNQMIANAAAGIEFSEKM